MNQSPGVYVLFIVVGGVVLALSVTSSRAGVVAGLAFIAAGAVSLLRQRRK